MDIIKVHNKLKNTIRKILPVKSLSMVLLAIDIIHNNNIDKNEKIETSIINCLVSLS